MLMAEVKLLAQHPVSVLRFDTARGPRFEHESHSRLEHAAPCIGTRLEKA